MKRRISLFVSMILAIALVAVIPFATMAFDQETEIGDVENGYLPQGIAIHNGTEFANMEPNGKYYIANDITVDATYVADFTGTLDGNGKIITVSAPLFKSLKGEVKNLKLTGAVTVSAYDAGALAQRADGATVTNVLNHAKVTGSTTVIALAESEYYNFKNVDKATGTLYNTYKLAGTGGLVGSATGVCTFRDCLNLGDVNGSPAGGIVGVMGYDTDASSFTFVNCHNEGNITDVGTDVTNMPACKVDGDTALGGIAGFAIDYKTLLFEGCTNKGAIASTLNVVVPSGGILGCYARHTNTKTNEGTTATFRSCINEGTVNAKNNCGGIMGGNNDGIAAGGVSFTDCVNKGNITTTASRAGGIAGECSKANFEGCVNNGKITGTIQLGGMVGRAYGVTSYNNCNNTGFINGVYEGGGYQAASAGIAGYVANNITVTNCNNTGNVTNPNGASIGGIIGNVSDSGLTADVTNCNNSGNIEGKYYVAGIVAYCEGPLTITNCKNTGESVKGEYRVGGITGRASNTTHISKCINYAEITATGVDESNTYAGGISGSIKTGVVSDCFNYGNVKATTGGRAVGGIVGYFGAKNGGGETVIRCGNHGDITNGDAWTGGICGYVYAQNDDTLIDSCYNVGNITGTNSSGGAIGYISVKGTHTITVKNSFFAGTYTSTKAGGVSTISGYNSVSTTVMTNVYYSAVATHEGYTSADDNKALNPNITASAVASGELVYMLNASIKAADPTITTDVFYQNLETGEFSFTAAADSSNVVIKNENGTFENLGKEPEATTTEATTTEEEPTTPPTEPEDTTTTTPEEEPTTPVESETVTTEEITDAPTETETDAPTESAVPSDTDAPEVTTTAGGGFVDGPVVGDSIATVIIVVAVALVAIASTVAFIVIKKKEN